MSGRDYSITGVFGHNPLDSCPKPANGRRGWLEIEHRDLGPQRDRVRTSCLSTPEAIHFNQPGGAITQGNPFVLFHFFFVQSESTCDVP